MMKCRAIWALVCVLLLFWGRGIAAAEAELQLAKDGHTTYQVVMPDNPSAVDEYAVQQLVTYMKQITGAEFAVTGSGEMRPGKPSIFIGMSAPVVELLGGNPAEDLQEQEHVARSVGNNIFLYGEGLHGNLYAVMDFLETSLGWRWFSVHEDPVLPHTPTVSLEPFERKLGFDIKYRQTHLNYGSDFFYQHGVNMGYALSRRTPPFISRLPATSFVHSSFSYIPPEPINKYADKFKWQDKKDYFKTHPEFFSMNEFGERVPTMQLCYSNPALRAELTRNIIRDIEYHKNVPGPGLIVTLDAADTGGKFCHCPECQALEKQYGSNGGPMFDYLIELCDRLEKDYPNVMVRTLAYRRSQTQDPPTLPEGEKLPENLIIAFAPIEDAYHADWWNHREPYIQDTFGDLLAWKPITHHLWAWIYPNPWGTGDMMPIGNIERIVNNMRLMHVAGVEGLFSDHNGVNHRNSFHELQSYLLFKLMKDVNCDTDAVVKEFTDHHYGTASDLMRSYIHELEEGRKAMGALQDISYKSKLFDERTFPYLTVDNIYRWQQYFDRMEALTAAQPDPLLHVQTVRRKLDFATLWKWLELKEKHPEYFNDYEVVANRIRKTNAAVTAGSPVRPLANEVIGTFVMNIKTGGKIPELPEQLADVDPSRVRQYIPITGRATNPPMEEPEGAFGYAMPVHLPDMPFNFGFYQGDRATRDASLLPKLPEDCKASWKRALNRRFTLQREIAADEIVPGEYNLYELAEVTITPDSIVWFSAQSWLTKVMVGTRLYEPGAENRWKVYASIKFDGPTYGGTAKKDLVLVDRVILISMSEDQFKKQ